MPDANSVTPRWIGTATDIENRKHLAAEEEIHRNERHWHRLVESKLFGVVTTNEQRVLDANQVYLDIIGYTALTKASPVFLFTISLTGECLYASEFYYEFTGRPPSAVAGAGWIEPLHPDDRTRVVETWRKVMSTGDAMESEYRLRRADGVHRRFNAAAVPVRDETGAITGWYGGSIDIDDQKEEQDALREADRRKNEFLAMLAHELRNPLAPIVNALAILEHSSPAEPAKFGAHYYRSSGASPRTNH